MSSSPPPCKTETDSRDSHGGQSRIRAATFPARKTLEEFDFAFQTSLRRDTVLHLGQLDFLAGRENIVLLGPPLSDRTLCTTATGAASVEHVMAVGGIFEGVIVHTHPLPGHHRYAHADQIAEIRERGILLSVAADELDDVSASRRWADGDRGLEPRLRRAWEWLNSKL